MRPRKTPRGQMLPTERKQEEIVRLYKHPETLSHIAAYTDTPIPVIKLVLLKRGVKLRPPGSLWKPRMFRNLEATIRDLRERLADAETARDNAHAKIATLLRRAS